MDLKWIVEDNVDKEEIYQLAAELNVPHIIAQILLRRGVTDLISARKFFHPSVDQFYDPFLMQDMEKAVERLRRAILSDEEILIYGDYDVDGITSVSFLYLTLKELGAHVSYYIPDRQEEGYGLSAQGIEEAKKRNINLIVTVDCGITGHAEIDLANSAGIDVIVTDHHEPGPTFPNAVAVVDPKRPDCQYPFKQLAGVGVAFKLAHGLLQRMEIDASILENYIELVAIGTSADIVPLVDENRIFVKAGLTALNNSENTGMKALIKAAGIYGREIGTGQIVFIIAPRINAVGRMGNAERAVELLTTHDEVEAERIAAILERENQHRKNVDEEAFNEAIRQTEEQFAGNSKASSIILHKQGWHTGVIGIVASRVVERYYRPTILISVDGGVGKGSARSVPGFDLYEALKQCEDLFIGFGGHKYAAGLTIAEKNIDTFKNRFEAIAKQYLTPEHLSPKLYIEAEIRLGNIDEKFVKLLKMFAPFGPQNMRPVFISRNLQIIGSPSIVGKNHLKFKVRQDDKIYDVIAFNMGELLYRLTPGEANLDMAYVIEENVFMGRRSIQLRAKDIR
ncbi:single-stranded-DNA-specific exonuclease RecJ [candidate division KSB1 bacterium]|nr:single-stranded-DNA-specific exonuclease RecJ [candidate division KSB1 bacterium]RQW02688.1 MAG: single-stranded-DNA-specific exonuclease RecJ [candidate division KSB1 bacterium]